MSDTDWALASEEQEARELSEKVNNILIIIFLKILLYVICYCGNLELKLYSHVRFSVFSTLLLFSPPFPMYRYV